jgi:RNase H-fold protein (predicted Holliday junction resolvase)
VRNFARRLHESSGLPVELHGEALTSVAADRLLADAGVGAGRRKSARDAEAAAVLLRDYFFERDEARGTR